VEDRGAEIVGYVARVGSAGNWGDWADLDTPATITTGLYPNRKYTKDSPVNGTSSTVSGLMSDS